MKILKMLLLAFCTVNFAGCGGGATDADYGKLGLVSVSGKLSLDGEPLVGAYVQFEASDQTFSWGTTNSSGYYSLQLNSEQSGVLPGTKTIRIFAVAPVSESDQRSAGTPEDEHDADFEVFQQPSVRTVPSCYNTKSTLVVEVPHSTASFDFDLKSDGSTTGAN